jgi:hypothetical protein
LDAPKHQLQCDNRFTARCPEVGPFAGNAVPLQCAEAHASRNGSTKIAIVVPVQFCL